MIELTVKTLDSQNHQFAVEDDITVEQFKVKIAETVNIPAETQRIIYCGRVLQDSSKLADYDVHGKVVHLVQRPPPGSNPRPTSRPVSPQPQPQRRTFRGLRGMDAGNPMYLASMAFPGNLMESQGIVPPPPTHSLSGSRLIVAKRMLRRAENILTLMENPNARPQDIVPDDNQEEEVTPVIEARVLVPNRDDQPIADVLNVFHDSLLDATTSSRNDEPMEATPSGDGGDSPMNVDPPQPSDPSEPAYAAGATTASSESPPLSGSTENLTAASAAADPSTSARSENGNTLPENASSTSEMAELMTTLNRVQSRFAPFSERYHRFMSEDPTLAHEEQRNIQLMLNRCSEIMHYLGHAYHSLSDIMIRVRAPPPRPLLCRPILIQHSAVVQTGIPIQVEINLSSSSSSDRQATTSNSTTSTTSNSTSSQQQQSTAPTTNSSSSSTSPETTTNAATAPPTATNPTSAASAPPQAAATVIGGVGGGPSISVQPGSFVGLPFLPGAAMRVQSFPVEIRTMRAPASTVLGSRPPQNNNNNTMSASQSGSEQQRQQASSSEQPTTTTTSASSTTQNAGQDQNGAGSGFNFNNPNVEFFMEVTPEGITIDSLETALVDSIQANDLLRGALNNGPPPEFLQSLMQMAGQIISHTTNGAAPTAAVPVAASTTTASATPTSSSSPSATTTDSSSTDAAQAAAATAAGQNSQARGNTQTHPTTATHTRSTPRPHVHLAQQAMAGGFDPFLPCNSHHISRRARLQATQTAATLSAQAAAAAASYPLIDNPFTAEYNEAMRRNNRTSATSNATPQSTTSSSTGGSSSSTAGAAASARSAEQQQGPPRLNLVSFVNGFFDSVRRQSESGGGGGGGGNSSSTTTSSRSSATTGPSSGSGGSGRNNSYDMPLLASLFSSMGVRNLPDVFRRSTSIDQLMQNVQHTSTYPGESLLGDLQRIIFRNLTCLDIITLSTGNGEPIARNLSALQHFVRTRLCNNDTSPHGIHTAVDRLLIELRPTLEHLNLIQTPDGVDLIASVERLLRHKLPTLIDVCLNLNQNNVTWLIDVCTGITKTVLALIIYCNIQQPRGNTRTDSTDQLMELILHRFIRNFPQDSISYPILTIRSQLRQLLTSITVPESSFREFIVERLTSTTTSATSTGQQNGLVEADDDDDDIGEEDNMSESEPCDSTQTEDVDNWVPILARDAAQHRQRRQNSQGAFSDAYLSGMPSKRRKLINNTTKPPESLPQVISDSVRQAVTATGLTGAAPLDVVAEQAAASPEIQAAYRSLLRTTVQASLRDNEDFVPERFPNVANYFKTDHQ